MTTGAVVKRELRIIACLTGHSMLKYGSAMMFLARATVLDVARGIGIGIGLTIAFKLFH